MNNQCGTKGELKKTHERSGVHMKDKLLHQLHFKIFSLQMRMVLTIAQGGK